MRPLAKAVALALLTLNATGCAPEFDPVQELETLRVLGVQKDLPYAAPGETVTLSMLWHDGSGEDRPVQTAWLSGCVNPPGDLYQGCFQQLPAALEADPSNIGTSNQHTFTVPQNVLEGRAGEPGQPVYGLSYVFFAVCAGTLGVDTEASGAGLPISCSDAAGNRLGSDDFVVGYSSIYTFEAITNQNPDISGFRFRGADVTPDCIGTQCLTAAKPEVDCATDGARCVPVCADDGEPECDDYAAEVVVSRESVESDEVSRLAYGSDFDEQLWVNYYVDNGSITPAVKLVNDAVTGWNEEQAVEFRAPKQPGTATIWAVVHDNRGGANFARFTFGVQ